MSTGSSKGLAAIRVPTPFRPKYLQLDRKVLCFQRGCRPQSAQICLSAANSGLSEDHPKAACRLMASRRFAPYLSQDDHGRPYLDKAKIRRAEQLDGRAAFGR